MPSATLIGRDRGVRGVGFTGPEVRARDGRGCRSRLRKPSRPQCPDRHASHVSMESAATNAVPNA
jgi:hypothetical protein